MKKILFLCVLICTALYAGAVPLTVSGIITTVGTGAPVQGQFVLVLDSLSGNEEAGFTESDGSYAIELDISSNTTLIQVFTNDPCTNAYLIGYGQVTTNSSGALEATVSFQVTECTPADCYVFGEYQSAGGTAITFNGQAGSLVNGSPIFVYSWDFGDSTIGTGSPVTHTYTQPGTYTVTLTATSSDCTQSIELEVEVVNTIPFIVTGTVFSSVGGPVPFWPISVTIPDINDPATFSTSTDQFGLYSITVFVPDSTEFVVASSYTFCDPTGNTEYEVPVNSAGAFINFILCDSFTQPQSCFAYITYTQTDSLSFNFQSNLFSATNSPFISFNRDFGDGTTSTEANPSHTYATADVYTVVLVATTEDSCTSHVCEIIFAFDGSNYPIDTFYYNCQALFFAYPGTNIPAFNYI